MLRYSCANGCDNPLSSQFELSKGKASFVLLLQFKVPTLKNYSSLPMFITKI